MPNKILESYNCFLHLKITSKTPKSETKHKISRVLLSLFFLVANFAKFSSSIVYLTIIVFLKNG